MTVRSAYLTSVVKQLQGCRHGCGVRKDRHRFLCRRFEANSEKMYRFVYGRPLVDSLDLMAFMLCL